MTIKNVGHKHVTLLILHDISEINIQFIFCASYSLFLPSYSSLFTLHYGSLQFICCRISNETFFFGIFPLVLLAKDMSWLMRLVKLFQQGLLLPGSWNHVAVCSL